MGNLRVYSVFSVFLRSLCNVASVAALPSISDQTLREIINETDGQHVLLKIDSIVSLKCIQVDDSLVLFISYLYSLSTSYGPHDFCGKYPQKATHTEWNMQTLDIFHQQQKQVYLVMFLTVM